MSLKGKWRITAMPDFEADYPDMVEPAYILFEDPGSGEFAFGCCTGHIWATSRTEATSIGFSCEGFRMRALALRWVFSGGSVRARVGKPPGKEPA